MNNKRKILIIFSVLAFIAIVVLEVLMCIAALVDGKYCLTESNYYHHIYSLFISLIVSNVLIVILFICLIKKNETLATINTDITLYN